MHNFMSIFIYICKSKCVYNYGSFFMLTAALTLYMLKIFKITK